MTDRKETCLAAGHWAEAGLKRGLGRAFAPDEAMAILERNRKEGLVLQPSNTVKAEFICSCCGCCCGMLRMQQRLPMPVELWASNFHAAVDVSACTGCGACEKRCQVKVVRLSVRGRKSIVDRERCIGCGLCSPVCPAKALSLHKHTIEGRPPQTREELYAIIMSRKKGLPAKLRLNGKLVVDALRTGRTDLLK